MNGMLLVAQEEFRPSARIVMPDFIGVKDASYTNGVGTILYATKYLMKRNHRQSSTSSHRTKNKTQKNSPFEKIKNWFSEFI